ncbi:MAG: alanine racemase, partial [Vicingaceae bacterium]
ILINTLNRSLTEDTKQHKRLNIGGSMGMATNSSDENKVKDEFSQLNEFFKRLNTQHPTLNTLSMGMSGDYKLAIEQGSNMIRVGSTIFGGRL